jgi:hypothetical protein
MPKHMEYLGNDIHLDYVSFSILMNLICQNCSEDWWGRGVKTYFMAKGKDVMGNKPHFVKNTSRSSNSDVSVGLHASLVPPFMFTRR